MHVFWSIHTALMLWQSKISAISCWESTKQNPHKVSKAWDRYQLTTVKWKHATQCSWYWSLLCAALFSLVFFKPKKQTGDKTEEAFWIWPPMSNSERHFREVAKFSFSLDKICTSKTNCQKICCDDAQCMLLQRMYSFLWGEGREENQYFTLCTPC